MLPPGLSFPNDLTKEHAGSHPVFAVCSKRKLAPILASCGRYPEEGVMTTVMVVSDDPAFLTRFCRIVASDPELELFAAVGDLASARQAMSKATRAIQKRRMLVLPRERTGRWAR